MDKTEPAEGIDVPSIRIHLVFNFLVRYYLLECFCIDQLIVCMLLKDPTGLYQEDSDNSFLLAF